MDTKISRILAVQSHDPATTILAGHLNAYQIAIAFRDRYSQEFQKIGKPIGGKGTGQQDSLAQYIALELSRRIKDNRITNIEGRFLYRGNLESLRYEYNGQIIESSLCSHMTYLCLDCWDE